MGRKKLFVAGLGWVGKSLVSLIMESHADDFAVCGLADSSGAIAAPDGFPAASLASALDAKRSGQRLAEMPQVAGSGAAARMDAALAASGADILVELSPTDPRTGGAALATAMAALGLGMDVVFASKGALVAAWDTVMEAAKLAAARVLFSATVGGGMPVIHAGRAFALGNPIDAIDAVLNGTSVYVLSMMETGMTLDAAVAAAQKAGMAEADPSADLDGWDAACKLCILSRSVMGLPLGLHQVARQSVREADPERIAAALAGGGRLRAVARLVRETDGAIAAIRLVPVPLSSPLARFGSENAVTFHSRNAGDLSLLGKGAGPRETASAVLRDLLTLR